MGEGVEAIHPDAAWDGAFQLWEKALFGAEEVEKGLDKVRQE